MNTTKQLYRKLNSYIYDDNTIQEVKDFITNSTVPAFIGNDESKLDDFVEKWNGFIVDDNKLIYTGNNMRLTVVPNDERENIVKKYYNDFAMSAGAGYKNLYYKICLSYLNISRAFVLNYLKKQGFYNMTRPSNHHLNRPIIDAPFPNMRWGIDTVDMRHFSKAYDKNNVLQKINVDATANKGFSYILTCIDYASRYVWAKALKDQKATSIVAALKSIMEESNTTPQIIQSDQGSSFRKEYKRFLDEKNVSIIYTKTYSPQSNGLVENFNGQLRKMLRDIMTRTKSVDWINHLQECVDNKNNSKNETTGKTPNQIWTAGLQDAYKNEIDENKANNIREARQNLLRNAQEQIDKYRTPVYEKGDLVHIKLSALYSKIRRVVKEGNKKLLVTNFTPEVYRVRSVIQVKAPDDVDFRPNLIYTVKTLTNPAKIVNYRNNDITLPDNRLGRQRYSKNEPMRFFASDFIKVESNNKPKNYSNRDVLKINDFYNKLGLIPPVETLAQTQRRTQATLLGEPIDETLQRGTRANRGQNIRLGEGIMIGGMIHSII